MGNVQHEIEKKKVDWFFIGGIAFIFVTIVSNLLMYKYLPEAVGIHKSGGVMDNHVSKNLFMLISPGALIVAQVYGKLSSRNISMKVLLVQGILMAANFWMLYENYMIVQ